MLAPPTGAETTAYPPNTSTRKRGARRPACRPPGAKDPSRRRGTTSRPHLTGNTHVLYDDKSPPKRALVRSSNGAARTRPNRGIRKTGLDGPKAPTSPAGTPATVPGAGEGVGIRTHNLKDRRVIDHTRTRKKEGGMTAEEQRKILEEIARNEDNYPRDRIAAVRALRDLAGGEPDEVGDMIDRILAKNR